MLRGDVVRLGGQAAGVHTAPTAFRCLTYARHYIVKKALVNCQLLCGAAELSQSEPPGAALALVGLEYRQAMILNYV